jgi:DNA topoisomerase-2
MDRLNDLIRAKEMVVLKKTQRKKKGHVKIEGLDPANNEGGKLSHKCTLILVEGLSAKTYAVSGIDVGVYDKKGRDWYGIYPLRGKLLNVRNSKPESIAKNAVITDIIKALGIEYDVDYSIEENYRKLRYGRIMILTDQDVDGIHISGLIQNAIHSLFPSLLLRNESFIVSMQTPIVRVFIKGQKDKLFYDERAYKEWLSTYTINNPHKKIEHKYYKGLGTSNEKAVKETFGQKIIEFVADTDVSLNMNKIFEKTQSDNRKQWLTEYNPECKGIDWKENTREVIKMNISDFLNKEMIKFSHNDCSRSIPNVLDGLKESHRKVLYSCFKRNLKFSGKTLKVAQLSGYVAEHSGYHHGEQNLFDTITKMANSYIGSNNIPILHGDGQFGSRIANGKDAASARYIFTKLGELTRTIFRPEDDVLLTYQEDDGDLVEPQFYIPIIPMILINGCNAGIGTGWSSSVPCYNPLDLVDCVKMWLENNGDIFIEDDDENDISILPNIIPWYKGFTGKIEECDNIEKKYISYGRIIDDNNIIVNELPVGMSTDKFKDFLEDLKVNKKIKTYKNYSKTKTVHFVIKELPPFKCTIKSLKLQNIIPTTNMVAFTENDKICKFNTIDEIIDYFCGVRFRYYIKRKQHQIKQIEDHLTLLGNKKRFLQEVMNDDIKLFVIQDKKRTSRNISDLTKELENRKYDKIFPKDSKTEEVNSNGYNYLLGMQFRSITSEKINKLENDIASNIKTLNEIKNKSEKDMWITDLDEFVQKYNDWIQKCEKNNKNSK